MTQAKHLGNACSSYALSSPICTPPCGRRHAPYTLQHTMHTDHAHALTPVPTVTRTCVGGSCVLSAAFPAPASAPHTLQPLLARLERAWWRAVRHMGTHTPPAARSPRQLTAGTGGTRSATRSSTPGGSSSGGCWLDRGNPCSRFCTARAQSSWRTSCRCLRATPRAQSPASSSSCRDRAGPAWSRPCRRRPCRGPCRHPCRLASSAALSERPAALALRTAGSRSDGWSYHHRPHASQCGDHRNGA